MDFLECSLCSHQYNEDKRRARTLFCAHYFCQECLDQVINSSTPKCPTCRSNITTNSAKNLHPNFLMDDLLSKMKSGVVSVDIIGDEDFIAGTCVKHMGCKLYFICKTHNKEICRECAVLDHPTSHCQLISFKDELNEKKHKTLHNLDIEELDIDKKVNALKTYININKTSIQHKKNEVVKLQKKIDETNFLIKECERDIGSTNQDIEGILGNKSSITAIKKGLVSTKSVKKMNNFIKDAECLLTKPKFANLMGESVGKYLTAEIDWEQRFTILGYKSGYIQLPALSKYEKSSAPRITINISSLLARFDWNNADIYLELESDGEELGTVYVELKQDPFSQYIRKLCMGTIGSCYRGTIFKGRDEYSLYTGNVTEYDTSVCTETIPALSESELLQYGSVYIEYETGLRFCISYSSNCYARLARVVGNVKEGMSILEAAWHYPDGKVKVKDVGIVLQD